MTVEVRRVAIGECTQASGEVVEDGWIRMRERCPQKEEREKAIQTF
jgi:hypothetical protein